MRLLKNDPEAIKEWDRVRPHPTLPAAEAFENLSKYVFALAERDRRPNRASILEDEEMAEIEEKGGEAYKAVEAAFESRFQEKYGLAKSKGGRRRQGRPTGIEARLKASVLSIIEGALERMEVVKTAIEEHSRLKDEAEMLTVMLPPRESADILLRYRTTFERGHSRMMEEFRQLQKARLQSEERQAESGRHSQLGAAS